MKGNLRFGKKVFVKCRVKVGLRQTHIIVPKVHDTVVSTEVEPGLRPEEQDKRALSLYQNQSKKKKTGKKSIL